MQTDGIKNTARRVMEGLLISVLKGKGPMDQRPLHCEVFGYARVPERTAEVIWAEQLRTNAVLESMFERKMLDRKRTRYGRATVNSFTYSLPKPKQPRQPLTDEQKRQKAEAKAAKHIYSDLPKIIIVLGVTDHGPCDGGASAICPHCGAEGRYVYVFKCADGSTRGAMKGCLAKFPRHAFAIESARILEKEQDYKKRGWSLPTWDIAIKDAIWAFADGQISESAAIARVRAAQEARQRYRQRRRF